MTWEGIRLLWFMLSTSWLLPLLLLSRLLESEPAARRPEDGPRIVGTQGSSRSESFLEPSLPVRRGHRSAQRSCQGSEVSSGVTGQLSRGIAKNRESQPFKGTDRRTNAEQTESNHRPPDRPPESQPAPHSVCLLLPPPVSPICHAPYPRRRRFMLARSRHTHWGRGER